MGIFEGFLHPMLAWGAALAAIPLLIHLLNRRRHRPLSWGAMRFVLAAHKRTRRRVQMENWLLLLMRMAAVALLALAIARPFIGADSPLAPLTEKRRDVVLILDNSASTGYRDVVSVHEAILERARTILADLDGTRGDRVRLLLAASGAQLVSSHAPEDALAVLSTVERPRDEPLALEVLLAEAASMAEEDAGESGRSALEIRLLTDLQRRTFLPRTDAEDVATPGEEPSVNPLEVALERLAALDVSIWVEDLGPPSPQPANLGIEVVEPIEGVLGAGLATEIGVRVRNYGPGSRGSVRVALSIDGQRQPSQKVDVSARSATEVVFPVVFDRPGHHALLAELEGDRLTIDDRRSTVVFVPPPLSILLVNGAPSEDLARDEVGVLRAALEPPDDDALVRSPMGAYAPFLCTETSTAAFGSMHDDLAAHDIIVLANTSSFSSTMVAQLEQWVADGGCLFVTLGDRAADPSALDSLNARMWRADESGLLPARLVRHVAVASRYGSYFRAATFEQTHPALAFFADERWRPYLTELPVYEFVAAEALENARTLISLDDEQKSPLLLERAYERGRVFLWTTSIDGDWNVIPQSPATLIPLMHELFRYGGAGLAAPREAPVGGTLELEFERFPRGSELVRPDGSRLPLDVEAQEVANGTWLLGPIGPLDRAGTWQVVTESSPPVALACLFEPGEGDLQRISPDELGALHPVWRFFQPGDDEGGGDEDPLERGELWRWLAAGALFFLVAETLWAAWIGRARRVV